jgi:K+-transporting ATPase ATPase A chain
VAGLMLGRTPEYLGKKIEAKEMKMAVLAILCLPLAMLAFTAIASVLPPAVASVGTAGPHGFSEILYAYTSAAANNGSAFGGLTFFPALALGPVVEHLAMLAGQTF